MKEKKNLLGGNINGLLIGSVVVLFFGAVLLFKQNESLKNQVAFQEKTLIQQANLTESVRKSGFGALVGNILNKVDQELNQSSTNQLSDETIARIAAVAYSLKPYRSFVGDSLSAKSFSPERGQLLLALSKMGIDSTSFSKIIFKTSFAGADLNGADLRNANLAGIDLSGANLREADLRGANFKKANLKGINLWAADLNKANMEGADLEEADLRWAELNEAILQKTKLNGAKLTAAKLRGVNLTHAFVKWADLNEADLREADLTGTTLFWTQLERANLTEANCSKVDMKGANLKEANLREANFTGVRLIEAEIAEENWLEKLDSFDVLGAKEIQEKYKVIPQSSGHTDFELAVITD